jgi:hypothetical protein
MEEDKLAKARRLMREAPADIKQKLFDKYNEIDKRAKEYRKMKHSENKPQVILVMGGSRADFRIIVDEAKEKLGSDDRVTIVAPEMIYRHPKALIQFVRDIVASKLPCLIITYNDYVAKEINNLVMLGYNERVLAGLEFEGSDGFLYLNKHILPKDKLRAYIFDNEYFNEIEVTEYGMAKSAFDDEIVSIDMTAIKLAQQMIVKDDRNNNNT